MKAFIWTAFIPGARRNGYFYISREVRSIDALVTNFHTPRSTLLMLVAAFAGYDCIMRAYREAVQTVIAFSYGDAMLIFRREHCLTKSVKSWNKRI